MIAITRALLIWVAFIFPNWIAAQVLSGQVLRVVDGDTLELKLESNSVKRVRLADIDTPELDQPWGTEAKAALSTWTQGKRAQIEIVDTDRHGRLVARMSVADEDLNRKLVELGHAWVYRKYLRDESLLGAEATAREQRLGLWSAKMPIVPSEWRKGKREDTPRLLERDLSYLPIKQSRSGICHEPGSTYYDRTRHYIAFESIQACLEDDGRLPKR